MQLSRSHNVASDFYQRAGCFGSVESEGPDGQSHPALTAGVDVLDLRPDQRLVHVGFRWPRTSGSAVRLLAEDVASPAFVSRRAKVTPILG